MVTVIRTVEFDLEGPTDPVRTRLIAQLPKAAESSLRESLRTQYGARWTEDATQFGFEIQYALSVSRHLRAAGILEAQFRPEHVQLPLAEVVDQAATTAKERADWPVVEVEILEEQVDHRFGEDYGNLVFVGRFVARVTQTRT